MARHSESHSTTNATSKMKWTALNEYLISHDGALLKKNQHAGGVGNREFVLEHDVYDIIVNAHFPLLHMGRSKSFKVINERYYGIAKAGVLFALLFK